MPRWVKFSAQRIEHSILNSSQLIPQRGSRDAVLISVSDLVHAIYIIQREGPHSGLRTWDAFDKHNVSER